MKGCISNRRSQVIFHTPWFCPVTYILVSVNYLYRTVTLRWTSYIYSARKLRTIFFQESIINCYRVNFILDYIWTIIRDNTLEYPFLSYFKSAPSWSWSYGSWIYNYICNQCLSPLTLWVRIPIKAKCTRYNIMWSSLSVTYDRSVGSPGTPVSSVGICALSVVDDWSRIPQEEFQTVIRSFQMCCIAVIRARGGHTRYCYFNFWHFVILFWWGPCCSSFLIFCVVPLCIFTFGVPCCDVYYHLRIKTMFDSCLPPVVCRRAHVLFTLFVFVCE